MKNSKYILINPPWTINFQVIIIFQGTGRKDNL